MLHPCAILADPIILARKRPKACDAEYEKEDTNDNSIDRLFIRELELIVETENNGVEDHEETDGESDDSAHRFIGRIVIPSRVQREHRDHANPRKDLHGEKGRLSRGRIITFIGNDLFDASTERNENEGTHDDRDKGNIEISVHHRLAHDHGDDHHEPEANLRIAFEGHNVRNK